MMRFNTLLKNPADWMANSGEGNSVVMTSRVRLARNLLGEPFPGWAKKEERVEVLSHIRKEVEGLPQMKGSFSHGLEDLTSVQKQVLVERHLISREQAARGEGSATVVNRKQTFSIMLNEEDHLRMQSIRPGLNIRDAFNKLSKLEENLAESVNFAFDGRLGYLTACPTNVGTGMRASAMLHLPGLVLADEVGQTLQGIRDVEVYELNARQRLLENDPEMILDQVGRAYGVLKYSHVVSSKEALNLLSILRLGVDLGFFDNTVRRTCDLLLMDIQPAHLQLHSGKKLDAELRDSIRAEIIRARLQELPPPATTQITLKEPESSGEPENE